MNPALGNEGCRGVDVHTIFAHNLWPGSGLLLSACEQLPMLSQLNRMSQLSVVCLLALPLTAAAGVPEPAAGSAAAIVPTALRIGFGSCVRQDRPAPIFEKLASIKPDVFVFLGDNIYGDTEDMAVMRSKYATLAALPGFTELRGQAKIVATWDDHDYGKNDAGVEFAAKAASQREFCDFWNLPADALPRMREGVHDAVMIDSGMIGPDGKPDASTRTQIITLDTRTFRSTLARRSERTPASPGPYTASDDAAATVLGQAQWKWLELELAKPAAVRIIASSIQVVATDHGYETWGNFPAERKRLLKLISGASAAGDAAKVIISGDRHWGEVSVQSKDEAAGAAHGVIDVTSSALNQKRSANSTDANARRIGQAVSVANAGMLDVRWDRKDAASGWQPTVSVQLIDEAGAIIVTHTLAELLESKPATGTAAPAAAAPAAPAPK